jgi:endoglucanase
MSISLTVAAVVALMSAAPAAATPPVVRSGGPSDPGEAKVAIVASDGALSGARFRVSAAGRTVLLGRLGRARGSSAPWTHAYHADLSRLRRPGRYRVHAAGAVSRPWVVRSGGSRGLVSLLLRFFRSNRDGDEPALLHAPSHLNDAVIRGGAHAGQHFDITGGWMDAGDTLHFTQNAAFATVALEAAAQLDRHNRPALRREADVGADWLLKAHPAPDLFITQVGDPRDHDRGFVDPAADDASGKPGIAVRGAFHWGTGVGGDIGGKAAAALGMVALRTSHDPTRRAALIASAKEWYAAGRAAGRATPAAAGSGGFYVVDGWRDSLAAGAAALYAATQRKHYRSEALRYLRGSSPDDLVGYANLAPIAAAQICGRLGRAPLGDPIVRRPACRFLRRAGAQGAYYADTNAFAPAGYFTWGTTASDGAGGAIALISGVQGGRAVAAGARDYLLGRNPWGASFVAGFGPHSPRKIHSWASVFGDGLPDGAVVGGPAPAGQPKSQGFRPGGPLRAFNGGIVYEDRRADYVTSEPAIDYAASCILLLAALDR